MIFDRLLLQQAFGNNPRMIAQFEELDKSLSDSAAQAQSILETAQQALETANEASGGLWQPQSAWLAALAALPYTQAGSIEIVGADQVAVRPIDSDDEASLVTQAFLGPYFASRPNAANDAAAAAAGVPINGIYRNGSAVCVRIA